MFKLQLKTYRHQSPARQANGESVPLKNAWPVSKIVYDARDRVVFP